MEYDVELPKFNNWHPEDFCKRGYYGINNKNVPVCGKLNYDFPCIGKVCPLYRVKKKGIEKYYGINP